MYDVVEKDNIKIENMIYEIRGVQVILDRDLVRLYVETKVFVQSFKRNINKYSNNFIFQLTKMSIVSCYSKLEEKI